MSPRHRLGIYKWSNVHKEMRIPSDLLYFPKSDCRLSEKIMNAKRPETDLEKCIICVARRKQIEVQITIFFCSAFIS